MGVGKVPAPIFFEFWEKKKNYFCKKYSTMYSPYARRMFA